jgi:tRNA threonylcarbamoyladenosine biosynthesis protein TsaE
MEFISETPEDFKKLAGEIAENLTPNDVLALYGDLGAGKTTFTRYLVECLGISARVQSPTFVIARKYNGSGKYINTVNHIDLYRVSSEDEIDDLGLDEIIREPSSVTVIEWPEMAEKYLPENVIKMYFEYFEENQRKITIKEF